MRTVRHAGVTSVPIDSARRSAQILGTTYLLTLGESGWLVSVRERGGTDFAPLSGGPYPTVRAAHEAITTIRGR